MSAYSTEKIRNLVLIGHGGSGKTTFAESLLFDMGKITRMGSVEAGNTVSDYRKEEIDRKISISSTLMSGDYNEYHFNMIDTPGFADFLAEVKGGLRVADTAVVLVNSVNGVEVGTEQVWDFADEAEIARVIVVNNLDRENANFESALADAQENFGNKVSALQFPANQGEGFNEIVDLLSMKLLKFERDGSGGFTEEDIPSDLSGKAEEYRQKILENAAEADDELLEKFFEEGDLTQEQFVTGLKRGIASGSIVPVLCASASGNIGSSRILDIFTQIAPSPKDVKPQIAYAPGTQDEVELKENMASAFVWKTVAEAHVGELSLIRVYSGVVESSVELLNASIGKNEKIGQMFHINGKNREQVDPLIAGDMGSVVKLKITHTSDTLSAVNHKVQFKEIKIPEPIIRTAVVPKSKGDEEKISTGLQSLHESDPSFFHTYDAELGQTIVAGQGELHLDVIIAKLKDKFGVEVDREDPKIPYRETIRSSSDAEGKHKKQSGGRGQFGVVNIKLEPLPRGEQFEFVNAIFGGAIPSKYVPAVEKGLRERMEKGVIAGNQVVDIRVTLYDGKFHDVDSSEMAFKIAASLGLANAFVKSKPVILEPIYDLEVKVPEEYMGDVMGDISSRRGKIQGMDSVGKYQLIKAKVPLAELNKYSTSLRSMTQGRGIFTQKFSHYEDVPMEVQNKLVEAYEASKAEGTS